MFFMTAIDEALVAGPAIRKIKIAPAETPLAKRATAIGIDAVAQTYKGKDTINMIRYIKYESKSKIEAKNSGGRKSDIPAAIKSP